MGDVILFALIFVVLLLGWGLGVLTALITIYGGKAMLRDLIQLLRIIGRWFRGVWKK